MHNLCVCSDNPLLPCPSSHLVTADIRVMRRSCFNEDVLLLSSAASLLACVRVCVCRGEVFGSICAASPALLWPSYFFLLELCDAASCSVLCAIGIAQQWSVRGKQLQEGFAWFWEVAGAYVCLVGKGVWFWGEGRTYLGLLQPCLLLRVKIFPLLTSFLSFSLSLSPPPFLPDAEI